MWLLGTEEKGMPGTETSKRPLTWQSSHQPTMLYSLSSSIQVTLTGTIRYLSEIHIHHVSKNPHRENYPG